LQALSKFAFSASIAQHLRGVRALVLALAADLREFRVGDDMTRGKSGDTERQKRAPGCVDWMNHDDLT
jgi:hypothetical protein